MTTTTNKLTDLLDNLQQAQFEYQLMLNRHGLYAEATQKAYSRLLDFGNKSRELLNSMEIPRPVSLTYTNYKGETAVRRILPKSLRYGSTQWHPEPQWLLLATDVEKLADREFALKDFGQQNSGEPVAYRWRYANDPDSWNLKFDGPEEGDDMSGLIVEPLYTSSNGSVEGHAIAGLNDLSLQADAHFAPVVLGTSVESGPLEAIKNILKNVQLHTDTDKLKVEISNLDNIAKQILSITSRHAGSVDWVDCPICGESDMRKTTSDGNSLIECVNHGCASNGGSLDMIESEIKIQSLEWKFISNIWISETSIGVYEIVDFVSSFNITNKVRLKTSFHTAGLWFKSVEEAKAAAQDDYETRVRSALA